MAKILLIEDDLTFSHMLKGFLQKNGNDILSAENIKRSRQLIEQNDTDLLLLDYRLPDGTALDLLDWLNASGHTFPVIIMTSFNDVRTAVKAIRLGAFDYITKPVNPDELQMLINTALGHNKADKKTSNPPQQYIKGNSAYSEKLHSYIDIVAPTDMSVLVQGESG